MYPHGELVQQSERVLTVTDKSPCRPLVDYQEADLLPYFVI